MRAREGGKAEIRRFRKSVLGHNSDKKRDTDFDSHEDHFENWHEKCGRVKEGKKRPECKESGEKGTKCGRKRERDTKIVCATPYNFALKPQTTMYHLRKL